jgi:hypothetical protein
MGNYQYVKDRVSEDFTTYSGRYLEKLIRELLAASGKYNQVGSYWESDNTNEIDVVAFNEHEKKLILCDVKLQAKNLNEHLLTTKSIKLLQQYPNYDIQYKSYSLDNLEELINSSEV